tara:strand:- start:60 stop:233 length:174 start_codon:yes stop_codon:yes gene_type:complete
MLFWYVSGGLEWQVALSLDAHVAQLVEHILGKDEVTSSNLVMGSTTKRICSALIRTY